MDNARPGNSNTNNSGEGTQGERLGSQAHKASEATNGTPASQLISFRPGAQSDLPFIYSTWLKGQMHGCEFYKQMRQQDFYSLYTPVLNTILTYPEQTVRVACLSDDPDVILAYAVYSLHTGILHWVHTKRAWRGQGIAKSLLEPIRAFKQVSGTTAAGAAISRAKGWDFTPLPLLTIDLVL